MLHLSTLVMDVCDTDRSLHTCFQVLNLDGMDGSRHWQILGCSAYAGDGLLDGFDWLVQDIASRIYVLD
jgi:ADP-ribosylation factor-like protein 2